MDITKIFATVLTLAGMFLLIFVCFAVMQGSGTTLLGVSVEKWDILAPFALGMIFFVAGLMLFKSIVSGNNGGR